MLRLRRAAGNRFFVLVPIFSAIILISFLFMIYLAYTTPIDVVTVNQVALYRHSGSFDYVAELKPNFIYGTSILRPGEGVLYTKITKEVRISFVYGLDGFQKPENVSLATDWEVRLESKSRWSKVFSEDDTSRIFNLVKGTTSTLTVNVTDVLKYVNVIEKEAGFYPSTFNLTITPIITESFTIAGRPIKSIYSPALTMEFIIGDRNGEYISMRNLSQSEVKSIDDKVTTHNEAVSNQRIMWPMGALLALVASVGSTWLRFSSAPRGDDELEKILASHRELIVRNSTGPAGKGKINVLESFDDLAKASEILLKPILLHESDEWYVFWLYDGNVEYRYKLFKKIVDDSFKLGLV